ncbi:MAG: patatin-like phospholipase family protein [Dehalococcoidales bacterium]|nr:patatin-like phospholipase family protein [Dehalococcoidales bacterium]
MVNSREKYQGEIQGRKPEIAMVLGGGGLKSLSAVCLFEFLNQAGINIDLVIGCSGGGIMAAMYGAGFSSAQMREAITKSVNKKLFMNVDLRSLAGIAKLPFGKFDKSSGLLKSHRIRRVYQESFGDRKLEDLKPKTILQATDFQTGKPVILEKGLVADAVYASGALYPILPPISIDGRWYIDGGFSANIPVMEAVNRNMDIIIAMIFEEEFEADPQTFMDCYYTIMKTVTRALDRSQISLSVDIHSYEIVVINVLFKKYIQIWDVGDIPLIMETGRKAVDQKKEEIVAVIREFSRRDTA